jgi:predicted ATP-grasp superfamily ATP-dependent carboligase
MVQARTAACPARTNLVNLLIAGVSTRAAAESAARAGFTVTAIDAFGDLDQHPSVRSVSLAHHFTARAAALAAQTIECDAVVYLSSFENHSKAITTLAKGRALWGNAPEIVRRVRDPRILAEALRKRGHRVPQVRLKADTTYVNETNTESYVVNETNTESYEVSGFSRTVDKWLVKPLASGGGQRIWLWDHSMSLPPRSYLQEFIDGIPGSIVFVAAGGRAVPVGVSRQLVGEPAFGAEGFQYCGNVLTAAHGNDAPEFSEDETLVREASALAQTVVDEFDLVGVNGIDFIASDGIPYAIEVNPRWCASMELVERAYGLSLFEAHASACTSGRLPAFDLVRARRGAAAVGKAVLYARRDVTVGDTRMWLTKRESIRDIPMPGERISSGRPVCTIFADAPDSPTCHDALVESAGRVYAQLEAWCA